MNTSHTELKEKREKLKEIAAILKTRFIGLDEVIDETISLMMPWLLFPEAQLRPMVINLWGLTGSGKSALVQKIVELLDYKKLYTQLDMGEFESDSASWIKNILTDDLEFFHEKQAIICLDEFQFARTIDDRKELSKDKLRVIWELLDSGKINYIPGHSTYYLFRADACVIRIATAIKLGVQVNKGEVVQEREKFIELFDTFFFEDRERFNEKLDYRYFLSKDFIEGMFWLFEDTACSREAIKKRIMSSTLQEIMDMITEGMKSRTATRQLDLSRSLIFVIGNLDEAYRMSHNLNPDISADDLYEATKKITLSDIKRALRSRFRNEQIARLGNNHIIYKSFTREQFRELIRRELKRVSDFVRERFVWILNFDSSVVDIVYAEGVFPTQGTRPVFTTIKNLIEARLGNMALEFLEKQVEVKEIRWYHDGDQFCYSAIGNKGEIAYSIEENVNLKIESLRKSTNPQIQAYTAVHESGHAILAALTLRIIPSVVVSKTASEAEGFCLVNFPEGPMTKETLLKDVIITLGGYVAEKMIFGEQHTSSGVKADIDNASELANRAVKQYGMGSNPIRIAVETQDNEDYFFSTDMYSREALNIINDCELQAVEILTRNKLLLLKMADYLSHHSRMDEAQIGLYIKKYAADDWVRTEGFVSKENYFMFYDTLKDQLEAAEIMEQPKITFEKSLSSDMSDKTDLQLPWR